MRILVTGATGYIGGRLVPRLLEAGHQVRCLAREPVRLAGRFPNAEIVAGDVLDEQSIERALIDVDVAFYLIHSMNQARRSFEDGDRLAAQNFAAAARTAGLGRIIYLGALGQEEASLSPHLRSRHEVGEIFRNSGVSVTEFRAAIIVGSGSVSFEMIRYLTERLPVMIAPRWIDTLCQPISITDVIAYLIAELSREHRANAVYEIGGADVLSYKEMMLRYAAIRGLRRIILVVPFFTPRLSSAWVHLVTPIPASLARPLIDGLHNEVIVRERAAQQEFSIQPMGYSEALYRALNRYEENGPETTWFDAYGTRSVPGSFSGVEEGMLIDQRTCSADVCPARLFGVVSCLGGKRGWLYADRLWELRGLIDRLVGGVGMRRGRRSPRDLHVGDALDFWRVEAYEREKLLRLRAEMRLPGAAWLQFEVLSRPAGGSVLRQTAFFEPRGLFGYLYWYAATPFHALIFGNMAKRIVQEAQRMVK